VAVRIGSVTFFLRADDKVGPAERAELDRIGHGLELGERLIVQLIEQHVELD